MRPCSPKKCLIYKRKLRGNKKALRGAKDLGPTQSLFNHTISFSFRSRNEIIFPISRKNRILTAGILEVCRGLKSDSDAWIGKNSHFWTKTTCRGPRMPGIFSVPGSTDRSGCPWQPVFLWRFACQFFPVPGKPVLPGDFYFSP